MSINYLDIGLIVLLIFFGIWGFRKKLLLQLIIFGGIFISLFLAMESLEVVAPIFASISILSGSTAILITLVIVFCFVFYFYHMFIRWSREHANLKMPDIMEKGGGLIFGVLSGMLLATMLSMCLTLAPVKGDYQDYIFAAKFRPQIDSASIKIYDSLSSFVPGSITFIQNLEATTKAIGQENFDSDYYALLMEYNSTEAEKWMSTATK